jgi:putative tryptophan/tyrosine transport system substrate-binding protein
MTNHFLYRRRDFIKVFGGTAAAWPLVARAQQRAMPVIGFLHSQTPESYGRMLVGFHQGLKETGYVEGQNLAVEYRWGSNQRERLPELAADLVRREVAVIVAAGGFSAMLAVKAATSTIPIVIAYGGDPVRLGLIASLNRPGGNVTGVTFITTELAGKRLELVRQLIPQVTTVGYLSIDPQGTTTGEIEQQTCDTLAAGRALGLQVVVVEVCSEWNLEAAFATLVEHGAGALVVGPIPFFTSNRDKLLALAARHRIPAIYQYREFALDGGLMSYGASYVDTARQAGVYVGRILKGAKPADLPVLRPTKFELVINLKAAKALGLEIPRILLALADEVIE